MLSNSESTASAFSSEWAQPCVWPCIRLLADRYGCMSGESVAKGLKATWLRYLNSISFAHLKVLFGWPEWSIFAFRQSTSSAKLKGEKRRKEKMKPLQFNYKVHVYINRHLGIRYWQKLLTHDSKQMLLKSSAEHSHIHIAALKLGGALQGITWVGRTANLRCRRYHLSHPGRCQIILNGREGNQPPTNTVSTQHSSWCACITWCMIAVSKRLHILYLTPHICSFARVYPAFAPWQLV